MKIKDIFEMPAMTKSDLGFGLTQYTNDDFALVGGARSGSSNAGEVRLKYDIYSVKLADKLGDPSKAKIGFTELRVSEVDGEILGLINIELLPKFRKTGFGQQIVRDIVDTTKAGGIDVHDIQKKAKKFWDKMGVQYTDSMKQTGRLNKQTDKMDEAETLELPDLKVGDEVKVGKFKNRKAEITGFEKDDNNQPVMKTTKGDHKVFKNRHSKLDEITMDHRTSKGDFDRSNLDEFIDRAYPVGNVKGFKIFLFDEDEPEEVHYLVGDPNSEGFLGYVSLIFGERDKFYRTNVFFDPEIQGKGLAVPLYAFAIKHSGQTVVSDQTQTKGSKQLWQKLAKTPGINVYAWNTRTDEYSHYDPDVETDEEIWADNEALSDQHAELLHKIRELDYEFGQYEMSEEEYEEARARLVQMTQDIQNQGPSGWNDIRLVATTK